MGALTGFASGMAGISVGSGGASFFGGCWGGAIVFGLGLGVTCRFTGSGGGRGTATGGGDTAGRGRATCRKSSRVTRIFTFAGGGSGSPTGCRQKSRPCRASDTEKAMSQKRASFFRAHPPELSETPLAGVIALIRAAGYDAPPKPDGITAPW
ncbi:MAG: hypothetical protein AB1568_07880 [Thermodesulfobacteriota bacterium]